MSKSARMTAIRNSGALLAVPMLLIGARLMSDGPDAARAANLGAGEIVQPEAELRLSDAQAIAWDAMQGVDVTGPIASPILIERVPQADVIGNDEPAPLPTLPGGPTVRLTGVMATRSGGIATINGRVLRIGEFVAPGWKLSSVDTKDAAVEITRFDGTIRRINQPR
ncbi:MAG: hypothetical protein AAFY58_05875 [Planctomycetota bacterium]